MKANRVFLIVLDSFGIGEAPDAADWHDEGSNTIASTVRAGARLREMSRLGLANIYGVDCLPRVEAPAGAYARLQEATERFAQVSALLDEKETRWLELSI